MNSAGWPKNIRRGTIKSTRIRRDMCVAIVAGKRSQCRLWPCSISSSSSSGSTADGPGYMYNSRRTSVNEWRIYTLGKNRFMNFFPQVLLLFKLLLLSYTAFCCLSHRRVSGETPPIPWRRRIRRDLVCTSQSLRCKMVENWLMNTKMFAFPLLCMYSY